MRRARAAWFCAAAIAFPSTLACSPANAATPLASPSLPAADTWVPTGGGSLRVLDKQKAQSQVLDLKVGQTAQFETLSITLRACVVHPPMVPPDAAGFVVVTDSRDGEPGFHGWMLSGEPGVATLESPVYGVRVSGCAPPTDAAVAAAMPQAAPPAEPTAPLGDTGGQAGPESGTASAGSGSVPLSPTPSEPLDDAPASAPAAASICRRTASRRSTNARSMRPWVALPSTSRRGGCAASARAMIASAHCPASP